MFSVPLARNPLPFVSRSMMKFPLSLAVGCSLLLSLPAVGLPCRRTRRRDKSPSASPRPSNNSTTPGIRSITSISDRLLHTYLETLDYNKQYFTQQDVDEFTKKYDTELDDDIWLGDLSPAYVIYDTYQKRVENRVAKIKAALKDDKFDFNGHGSIEVSRQKSPGSRMRPRPTSSGTTASTTNS